MARLTAAQRNALPNSAFAGPNRTFPVEDKGHARAALSELKHAPASARARIRKRARAKLGAMKSLIGEGGTNPRLGA